MEADCFTQTEAGGRDSNDCKYCIAISKSRAKDDRSLDQSEFDRAHKMEGSSLGQHGFPAGYLGRRQFLELSTRLGVKRLFLYKWRGLQVDESKQPVNGDRMLVSLWAGLETLM